MLQDFKAFIARGNALDLAVGIIIGAAFSGIVNSLVTDIIMPPIGLATGGVDFSDLFINLSPTHYDSLKAAKDAGAPTINYGIFINSIVHFLIVAFAVFMLVRQAGKFQRKAPPAATPRQEILLEEIRDLLKVQK